MKGTIGFEKIKKILVCPKCKGKFKFKSDRYECSECFASYAIVEGIPVFVDLDNHPEAREIIERDNIAEDALLNDESEIYNKIKRSHHISLMTRNKNNFLKRFKRSCSLLDIGVGWGWHWTHTPYNIVGIDFSLKGLLIAKKLLKNNSNIFLVNADATMLPFEHGCFDGIWSVQTFQHLPPDLFVKAIKEMNRVLKKERGGYFEIRWLNDSYLLRLAYQIFGKEYQKEYNTKLYYLRRQNKKDLMELFGELQNFYGLKVSYDEFFFQPSLKFRHDSKILSKVDSFFSSIPVLNSFIANQCVISGVTY